MGRFESLFAPLDIRLRMYRRSDTKTARLLTVFPVKHSALPPLRSEDAIVPVNPDPDPLQSSLFQTRYEPGAP